MMGHIYRARIVVQVFSLHAGMPYYLQFPLFLVVEHVF